MMNMVFMYNVSTRLYTPMNAREG